MRSCSAGAASWFAAHAKESAAFAWHQARARWTRAARTGARAPSMRASASSARAWPLSRFSRARKPAWARQTAARSGWEARVKPWAVDVASGVESEPGVKDRAKLEAFFAAVRGDARPEGEVASPEGLVVPPGREAGS